MKSIRRAASCAVVAFACFCGSPSASASAFGIGEQVDGCWGNLSVSGCLFGPAIVTNAFTNFSNTLATATIDGGPEFSVVFPATPPPPVGSVFNATVDIGYDKVTVEVLRNTIGPLADTIVVLSHLPNSVEKFDIVGDDPFISQTLFGNNNARHGNFVALFMDVIPFIGDGDDPLSIMATIPEPATWALVLSGLAGLGFGRNRRARAAA